MEEVSVCVYVNGIRFVTDGALS